MNEPPKRTFTQRELIDEARKWCLQNRQFYTDDRYHGMLGLLIDFVTDLVLKEEKPE